MSPTLLELQSNSGRATGQPILAALRDGTPLPDRVEVTQTLPPMPVAPGFGDDHAAEQHIAVDTISMPLFSMPLSARTLASTCEMVLAAAAGSAPAHAPPNPSAAG
jgi:hypothetical protein